jgi:hypothetical protein
LNDRDLRHGQEQDLSRPQTFFVAAGIFISLSILGGLFWANLWFTSHRPGGQDFAVYWASARTLLEFDATPYGELASVSAQQAAGGTAQDASIPGFRLDLPLYSELTVFPFAAISFFPVARAAWMLLLEASLLATAFISLRWLDSASRLSLYLLPVFGVFWVQAVWPLVEGNAIILAALFIAAGFAALRNGRDEAAGVFLALGTFKFLTLGVLLIFVILWSLSRRRWRVPFAYLMSLGMLVIVSYFFYPNWFVPYLRAVLIDLRSVEMLSTGEIIATSFPALGIRFSYLLTGLVALVLIWECWLARGRDFRHMLWAACLALTLTPLLGLPTNPENYAALSLPVALVVLLVEERWGSGGRWIVIGLLALLLAGLWAIFLASSNPWRAMFFPAPILLTIALYWVRWWAIRPPRTWVDTIRSSF